MLIGDLRRVRIEFGNVGSFRIVTFRRLGGAPFATILRLVVSSLADASVSSWSVLVANEARSLLQKLILAA